MNTIILFWNPGISSYTIERLREDLSNHAHVSNWSVWEHEKAHKGDRFFMVRCGEGKTGICMSGRFRSDPYRGEDWSGKGREVYYMDLLADVVIDPDVCPILSTEILSQKISSFDWSGGHSGRLLPAKDSKKLERLWKTFLEKNENIFGKLTLRTDISVYDFDGKRAAICNADIRIVEDGFFEIWSDDDEVFVKGDDLDSLKLNFAQAMKEAGCDVPIEFHFENVNDEQLVFKALEIAKEAYSGMKDELGVPYFKRSLQGTSSFSTDGTIVTSLLENVLNNPNITPEKLIKRGIPKFIVEILIVLHQKENEDFETYIQRVSQNPAAAHILHEKLSEKLYLHDVAELTPEMFTCLAQELKAYHKLDKKGRQQSKVVFDGLAKDFRMWRMMYDEADTFAIRGEYCDEDIATMSQELVQFYRRHFFVDISELNIHREAKYDCLIRTYEDDIINGLRDDEIICLLEKMIVNRKYSDVFEVKDKMVFCDNGRVLVHVPVDMDLEIPETVEVIGRCAVAGNQIVESIEFPTNVRIIDDYAFCGCDKLYRVIMNDGITTIGESCFHGGGVGQLQLSRSLTEIPYAAFSYNWIEYLEIPSSVKHIGAEAFQCNYIDNDDLIIPEGVEVIEYNAFRSPFKHVSLPSTLKEIAYDFYYEEMVDDPEKMKPYVDIHPDNPVYYSKGGILYRRDTGKEVLGKAGREQYLSEQNRNL